MKDKFLSLASEAKLVLRPFLPQAIGLAVVMLLGAGMAFRVILAPLPKDLVQDRWTLTDWQAYRAGTLRDEALAAQIWAENPNAKPKPQVSQVQAPPWRFVGTVDSGGGRLAVIEFDGLRVKRLAPGEDLPNGAHIDAVTTGELAFTENGEHRTLRLFAKEKPDDGKPKTK